MNILLFIEHFFVGFMVSDIPILSVFGHCPYSIIFPYILSTCIETLFLESTFLMKLLPNTQYSFCIGNRVK